MILGITGTHEQPFDRLVRWLDETANALSEHTIVQAGYSTQPTWHVEVRPFFSRDEIGRLADRARIIVCHGGPGSIWLALERSMVPIVVPRDDSLGEHVDGHQIAFAKRLATQDRVIAVHTKDQFLDAVRSHEELVARMETGRATTGVAKNRRNAARLIHDLVADREQTPS